MRRFGKTWIFDLDNTLHDARPHIFPHISRSMTDYVQTHLGIERPAAERVRVDYWQRYGATLIGLMRHHDVDPQHFLLETHDFPELGTMVVAARELRWTLRRLPGPKIVFSTLQSTTLKRSSIFWELATCFRMFSVSSARAIAQNQT